MKYLKIIILLSFSLFLFSCGEGNKIAITENKTVSETPAAKQSVEPVDEFALGRKIYMSNCAACHKEDGTGGKITIEGKTIKPDNLASAKIRNFDDATIYKYIYNGVEDEGMPAFKDKLSEADIREVVRFIRAEIQKIPAADKSN